VSLSPTGRPALPLAALHPVPVASHRPWAGRRLGEGVGEQWLAGPASLVEPGDGPPLTLEELAAIHGADLVGTHGLALLGPRFPLLVKVIDAAEWLSLQVHPDDALAAELHGPGALGKAEAWVVLGGEAGTRLITGADPALDDAALRDLIADRTMDRAHCAEQPGRPGDTFLIRAGTIHAIGAGLLVYEIEQPSDLTYRISDWGRPSTTARPLHTREALRAVVPGFHAVPSGSGWSLDGGALTVREFRLELVTAGATGTATVERHPGGASLEVVTAARGRVDVSGDGWHETLEPFGTVVIPAAVPAYAITGGADAVACVGSIP
jgi:mannose-6-phosphate isomerase